MNKAEDKKQIVQTIIRAANLYRSELVGRSFLYVFEGRYIEVLFRKKDFMHLTGVDSKLGAEEFYKEAVRGTLRHNQIYFSSRHPYDLCKQKMTQITNLSALTNSEVLMLEEMTTNTFVYKFGISELSFTVGLSEDVNKSGVVMSDHFIPRSLRIEDGMVRSKDAFEVHYIFCKQNNTRFYDKIMYADKRKNANNIPESVLTKLTPEIRSLIGVDQEA